MQCYRPRKRVLFEAADRATEKFFDGSEACVASDEDR
jgi:hypothetical protein